MLYAGNPELSAEAQERVTTAFRQAVARLQEGHREEASIGLEFVLRLDPAFTPAVNLRDQLASGAGEIDLSDIIAQMQAPTTDAIDALLVEAVESYNRRDFVEAGSKVDQVLLELPGHQEARQLQRQIAEALKVENQVGQFLAQAREALHRGDPQEAANFVMMAQALDPHHGGITPTLQEIYASGDLPQEPVAAGGPAAGEVSFEVPPADDDFGVHFDEIEAAPDIGGAAEIAAPEPEFLPAADEGEGAPLWEKASVREVAAPPVPTPARPRTVAAQPPAPDDLSDLFEVDPAAAAAAAPQDAGQRREQNRLDELLSRGEEAFKAGDYRGAIDAWSRIFLLETQGRGVAERIEEAARRLEEAERRVEHLLFEAQEAAVAGETERASGLVGEVLAMEPDNVRALELRERVGVAGAAAADAPTPGAGAAAEMPELEEDLFEEAREAAAPLEARPPILELEVPQERRLLGLPVRTAAVIGAAAVVLVAAGLAFLLLRGPSNGASPGDVYALRDQAEQLFKEGKVRDALALVEGYRTTDPADDTVLERLRERYQKALATPTPTPIPGNLIAAQELLARGLIFHAYAELSDGLRKYPGDTTLTELKERIDRLEPLAAPMQAALAAGNFQTAASIAAELEHTYAGRPDLDEILKRSLYNAALAEMRAYNLAGAETYLRQYEELDADDEVVDRIMEFIDKYKARPVDMTLQVFIGSLETRKRQRLVLETIPLVASPTPAAGSPAGTPGAAGG